MSTCIIWFRRDLRLQDNPALFHAARQADRLLAVYIDESIDDPWPAGGASRWWLHHSLRALDEALRAKGNRLHLLRGDPDTLLPELIRECAAGAVFANRRYEPYLQERDRRTQAALSDQGIPMHLYDSGLLHSPEAILNQQGEPYKVFTPYYRAALARGLDDSTHPVPRRLPPSPDGVHSLALVELDYLPRPDWAGGLAATWTPGEAGARQGLEDFLGHGLVNYSDNRDFPARDGGSRLSPHLHFGELSPRQVLGRLRSQGHPEAEAVIRQLVWRDFSHAVLHHFPHTSEQAFQEKFRHFPWRRRAKKDLSAWQRGQTGIPIVDAGMRELWHTGYMHNRVRMIVGSLLTKNLMIHWRLGAAWFWDTLVDADLAQNSMNWQWVAGSGVDAAPYFRIFNPVTQGGKFDADGAYVRRWVPELSRLDNKWLHKPWEADSTVLAAAGIALGRDYPRPLVDLKQTRQDALAAYQTIR